MSEVTTVFTAEDRQIQQALKNQQQQIVTLTEKYNALAKAGKKALDDQKSGLGDAIGGLGQLALQWMSVQTAVNFVTSAYRDNEIRLESLSKKAIETQKQLAAVLSASGDLAAAPKIRGELQRMDLTEAQAQKIFGSISAAAPSVAVDDRLALTREISPLVAAGDADTAATRGNLAAEFLQWGKSANDSADLAVAASQIAGQDAGDLTSDAFLRGAALLQKTLGLSVESTTAMGIETRGADLKATVLETIANSVSDESLKKRKPSAGGRLTEEDKLYNEYAEADAMKRWQMLWAREGAAEAVFGQGLGNRIGQIDYESVQRTASLLSQAQATDAARTEGVNLASAAPDAAMMQQADVAIEKYSRDEESDANMRQYRAAYLKEITAKHNSDWLQRAWYAGDVGLAQAGSDVYDTLTGNKSTQSDVLARAGLQGPELDEFRRREQLLQQRQLEATQETNQILRNRAPSVVMHPERGR
ncbi:MAG TPA: hypothetical protein VGE52_07220 [Pirellulales bacterium]